MADPYVSVPFQIGVEQISFLFKASTVQKVMEQIAMPKAPKQTKMHQKPVISRLITQPGIANLPVIQEDRPILKVKRVKFNTD